MSHQVITAYLFAATGITSFFGGNWAIANNAAVTPTNPSHQAGDTLLCVAFFHTGGSVDLTVSGSGWGAATGLPNIVTINPPTGASRVKFFMLECTGSSHANPTVTPSGGADQATVIASVWRIRGRAFGSSFSLGSVSSNASNNNTIALTQNSPSIAVGDMIMAIGLKHNDGGTGNWNTISGQTGGLTWLAGPEVNTNVGNDTSGVLIGAINDSGGAYTAGTGATITGRTLSVAAVSVGVYLKVAA